MQYWLCVTNERNWEAVREHGVWGVSERNRRRIELVEEGDMLIFYVKPKKIAGIMKATSKAFRDEREIFSTEGFSEREVFPYRVKLEPVAIPEKPLNFDEIIEELTFIKRRDRWTGHIRGAMRTIPKEDYETIISSLTRSR